MWYDINGNPLTTVYDINGNPIKSDGTVDTGIVRGQIYKFSDMAITDVDGVASVSTEHLENASSGYKLTTPDTAEHIVTFDGLNIKTNGEAFNLWLYVSRKDKGVTGGWGEWSTFTSVLVALNGGSKKLMGKDSGANSTMLVSGMNCYHWNKANTPATINSISFTIKSSKVGGSIFLDSVEIGRKFRKAHILMNFDSSGKNFYNLGYPLFKSYGFPATFDYWGANPVGANSGTWADATEAQKHFEMLNDGFDYGIYSKYVNDMDSTGVAPAYDDMTKYAQWQKQAEMMFKSNNVLGIKCPSTVHSTGHKSGEAYAKAMAEQDFLMVRADSAYSNGNVARQFIASVSEDYKEVVPYYVVNCWEATDAGVEATKKIIDLAIQENMAVMWMSHTIQSNDETHDALNIGYNAMKEILDYLHSKRDKIVVDSTATFMQAVYPERYAEWVKGRD